MQGRRPSDVPLPSRARSVEGEMAEVVVGIIVVSGIGWVTRSILRADAQQHAAQYRRRRPVSRSWNLTRW